MPFFIHSGAGALFQRWTIALLITCWKCLYCRPQPLIVTGKWLSFSRCVHAHILSAHPDTICLFYPTAALRVIMPGRTTALFVRRNEIRGEETTGEARQQGTDAIQRHPFVTANFCAVGSGSQGEALLLMWTMFMKDAQVPVALERLKFFLLDGVLFLQCSPKVQVQSISGARDPAELCVKRHEFIFLTKKVRYCSHSRTHSHSDTRCCILAPYLTVALPWVQSGDAPEKHTKCRHTDPWNPHEEDT